MEHAAKGAARLSKDAEGVLGGLARVDDDRQGQLQREGDLGAEDVLLHVARREVVVVVEANLSDRPRAFADDPLPDAVTRVLAPAGELPRLVRVDAERKADLRPERPHARGRRRLLGVSGRQDTERALHTGSLRPADDGFEIVGEGLVGQMAVASRSSRLSSGTVPVECPRLPHPAPERHVLIESDERGLATLGARGEHHPVRLDAHQLGGLEVEHDDDRPADELLGLVRF